MYNNFKILLKCRYNILFHKQWKFIQDRACLYWHHYVVKNTDAESSVVSAFKEFLTTWAMALFGEYKIWYG